MRFVLLIAVAFWASVTGLPSQRKEWNPKMQLNLQPQIVGGTPASPGEFPWQCSLKQELIFGLSLHICGAVVYDSETVLTAAHCVETQGDPAKLRVVCGDYDFRYTEGYEQWHYVQCITVHPSRNVETKENDLAYLTLTEPLEFNERVAPIGIAETAVVNGEPCINTGWGNTRGDGSLASSNILLKVGLNIVPFENCKRRYEELIELKDSMLCAGYVDQEDAEEQRGPCNGDSGGPLVCPGPDGKMRLVGVVSFGTNPCALPEYPGVFANMVTLGSWIKQSRTLGLSAKS